MFTVQTIWYLENQKRWVSGGTEQITNRITFTSLVDLLALGDAPVRCILRDNGVIVEEYYHKRFVPQEEIQSDGQEINTWSPFSYQ